MRTAFLVLSTRCNNACAFCFYRQDPTWQREQSLDAADFPALMDDLSLLDVDELILTGGEPLLVPGILEMIETARARGMRPSMITNGVLLDEELAVRLSDAGLDVLVWSLNDFHQPHAPGTDAILEDMDRRLRMLSKALSGRLSTIFVFTRHDAVLAGEVIELTRSRGVGLIVQPAYIPAASPDAQRLNPFAAPDAQWSEIMERIDPYFDRYGLHRYRGYLQGLYNGKGDRPISCSMGERVLVVDADRVVTPCFHRRDLAAGRLGIDPVGDIRTRLSGGADQVKDARCFGQHCVSLFVE